MYSRSLFVSVPSFNQSQMAVFVLTINFVLILFAVIPLPSAIQAVKRLTFSVFEIVFDLQVIGNGVYIHSDMYSLQACERVTYSLQLQKRSVFTVATSISSALKRKLMYPGQEPRTIYIHPGSYPDSWGRHNPCETVAQAQASTVNFINTCRP